MRNILAIDIGGTAIKYGVLNEAGTLLFERKTATEAMKGGRHLVEKVCTLIQEAVDAHQISGVSIATPGIVDTEKGEMLWANDNLPGYQGTQWKHVISSRFDIPCEVENDAYCAGIAEYHSGALQGVGVGLCLTIGTGIGGALLIDGKVFHGASFSAAEIGYLILPQGSFEAVGSAKPLVENVAAARGLAPDEVNGYDILQQAKAGDPIASDAIANMCDILGTGIANICYVVNPEVIAIGGGISTEKEYLYPQIRAAIDQYLMPDFAQKVTLRFAEHENLAGILGAFYNFKARQNLS